MRIVVLAGGISTERDVSLISGSMIYKALKKNGHRAVILDVYLGYEEEPDSIFEKEIDWTSKIHAISEINPDIEAIKAVRSQPETGFFGPNVLKICQKADVVFMALHGANGEDGKIQACFELLGISFTGSDYISSAMAMDKNIAKDMMRAYHIPVPEGIRLKKYEKEKYKISYPCIVKANCGGSSVGVCIAYNDAEYEAAKQEAFRYDNEVVVEKYICGREFSVGVMDGIALPVIEIAPKQGFYDYKNKYQADSTIETCPAEILEEETIAMQKMAEEVYEVLRMKNYARMDFMMSREGEIYCLEANTLPGMTPTSLLPQEAAAAGMSFEELCEKILSYTLKE